MNLQENFDCTQFITFDTKLNNIEVIEFLHLFNNIGLNIISQDEISIIKKEYLKKYFKSNVYELKNDTFLGNLDEWLNISDNPPKSVSNFIEVIRTVYKSKNIFNLTIILTSFAQYGKTSDQVFDISIDEIEYYLFLMSFNSHSPTIDNLILHIK